MQTQIQVLLVTAGAGGAGLWLSIRFNVEVAKLQTFDESTGRVSDF